MKPELEQYLRGVLVELEKLIDQVQQTRNYSMSNEEILLLKELVSEQLRMGYHEDSPHSANKVG